MTRNRAGCLNFRYAAVITDMRYIVCCISGRIARTDALGIFEREDMSLKNIIDEIRIELGREKHFLAFLSARKKMLPPGSLLTNNYRKDTYYYQQIYDKGKRDCFYLDTEIDEHAQVILELMEKKTLIHAMPIVRRNIDVMERFLKSARTYHPADYEYGELLGPDYYLEGDVCIREWKKKKESMNPYRREDLVQETKKGVKVRSKSEGMISDMLYDREILYKYETALKLGGKIVYPDFEILHPRTGELIWWEHLGKADSGPYVQKNLERLEAYGRSGIIQGKNLIVTSETLDRPLTRTTASRKLREYGLI